MPPRRTASRAHRGGEKLEPPHTGEEEKTDGVHTRVEEKAKRGRTGEEEETDAHKQRRRRTTTPSSKARDFAEQGPFAFSEEEGFCFLNVLLRFRESKGFFSPIILVFYDYFMIKITFAKK